MTGYKLTVEDNTIQNVKSHGFTIQGGGDGSAKTTIGEYSIKNNNFASWGLGGKDNRGAIKVWADTEIAPSDMSTSSVTALSEKAKEFVTHILNGGNTFGSQPDLCGPIGGSKFFARGTADHLIPGIQLAGGENFF